MLIKVGLLFLVAMAGLALIGRLRFARRAEKGRGMLAKPKTCPKCGRYQIGLTVCDCKGPQKGS